MPRSRTQTVGIRNSYAAGCLLVHSRDPNLGEARDEELESDEWHDELMVADWLNRPRSCRVLCGACMNYIESSIGCGGADMRTYYLGSMVPE